MHMKTTVVTPEQARIWLDTKNPKNRPIAQRTVDRYAQEMKAGRWKLNGEAIIFGRSGNLLNGQHRLKACVQAGKSFETVVTLGVEDEFFDTLDDGNPRKMSDVLAIKGEAYSKTVASALYFVYSYATNNLTRAKNKTIPTKQLLERLLETQPGIRDSVRYYHMLKQRPGAFLLPPSLGIGLHYIFSLVDEAKAATFFEQFQSGLNIDAGNPIGLLRQRLIAGAQTSNKLRTEAQYAYTVIAWNAYATGKKLTRMSFPAGDSLPEIHGVPRSLMKDLL